MFLATCVFLWVTSLLGVFLFGFLFGRCARKLPIIDETLPWTLHWGQVVPSCGRDAAAPGQTPARGSFPSDPRQGDEADVRHTAIISPCQRADCPFPRR